MSSKTYGQVRMGDFLKKGTRVLFDKWNKSRPYVGEMTADGKILCLTTRDVFHCPTAWVNQRIIRGRGGRNNGWFDIRVESGNVTKLLDTLRKEYCTQKGIPVPAEQITPTVAPAPHGQTPQQTYGSAPTFEHHRTATPTYGGATPDYGMYGGHEYPARTLAAAGGGGGHW